MSAVPVWNCKFKVGEGQELTVGAKFTLSCGGDIPVEWGKGPLYVVFPNEDQKFSLAVLKPDTLEATRAELTVTAYKPGEHKPDYIRIMQGEQGFEMLKPEWTVQSVLKPGEQVQPYPGFGPWHLPLPWWFLGMLGLALLFLTVVTVRQVRRHLQRKRLLQDLRQHRTSLPPAHQFYRDARVLRRRLNAAKSDEELKSISTELNREFRMYLLRQFLIPTLDWSDRAIVEDLRKRHQKAYKDAGDPLKKTLRELGRLKDRKQVAPGDVEQMHRMSLDVVERLDQGGER